MLRNHLIRLMCLILIVAMVAPMVILPTSAISPASTSNVTATLAYTLRNLKYGNAVQNFYIGEKYIYITQRSGSTTYLSRLEIRGNEAWYLDNMTLNTYGHGEGLDFYRYNGTAE